jgi:hypothetical protein
MTLPIANGLAGSARPALPEDAVCDWKGPIKGPFAIGKGFPTYSLVLLQEGRVITAKGDP